MVEIKASDNDQMSLQICVNCNELGMTWYQDEKDRTWWTCSECEFEIEEDESKECGCKKCSSALSVSWLMDKDGGFYWCFSCDSKTDQIMNSPNEK